MRSQINKPSRDNVGYDRDCQVVTFSVDGISFGITAEALQDVFNAGPSSGEHLKNTYRNNREKIDEIALRKNLDNKVGKKGRVVIITEDCSENVSPQRICKFAE